MTSFVFVGPTLPAEEVAADRRRRLLAAGRPGRPLSRGAAPTARDRNHRRIFLRRAIGLAQGDSVGHFARVPRLRQRQHGRLAGGGTASLRHARRRPDLRGVPSMARSKTTMKSRSSMARQNSATSRPPRRWSIFARHWRAAEVEGVLTAPSRRALEAFGKSLFFTQRNWEALLRRRDARRRRIRSRRR